VLAEEDNALLVVVVLAAGVGVVGAAGLKTPSKPSLSLG